MGPSASRALPSVSVVIPTRNRPDMAARALRAALSDPATSEVLVMADGDDGATLPALRKDAESDPRVRLATAPVADEQALGRERRARDLGASLARSEVILALDDDVVAGPGLVGGHARWHQNDSDLVVLGYMPVVESGRRGGGSVLTRIYGESYERACAEYESDPASILLGLWGGNFSVRRGHWMDAMNQPRVGDVFHVDRELGLVLRDRGLRGVFDRALRAEHWYRRTRWRFARDALNSGRGLARLHAAYPELLGPLPSMQGVRSRRVRTLLKAAHSTVTWIPAMSGLLATTYAAGFLRLSAVEAACEKALWRLGVERGMRRQAPISRLPGGHPG